VTVSVAQSTIQFVNLADHQSKFATSTQADHLATLPLLSLSSYTTAVSISYNQCQDVSSYVVLINA